MKQSAVNVIRDDEDLQESFEDFENFINDEDDVYARINVMEGIAK